MSLSVFKTLWKDSQVTKTFFKDFVNTLTKIKLKQKGLQSFRTAAFPTEQRCFILSGNEGTVTEADRKGSCSQMSQRITVPNFSKRFQLKIPGKALDLNFIFFNRTPQFLLQKNNLKIMPLAVTFKLTCSLTFRKYVSEPAISTPNLSKKLQFFLSHYPVGLET